MVDTCAVVRTPLAGWSPHMADRDRGGGPRRRRYRDRLLDNPRARLARDLPRVRDLGDGVPVGSFVRRQITRCTSWIRRQPRWLLVTVGSVCLVAVAVVVVVLLLALL
jgi:hypothetical protein